MSGELGHVRQKWRPSVRLILLVLNLTVVMLPIAGLLFFRIYENQLVRETERELIAQAAVLAPVFKKALKSEMADDIDAVTRPVSTGPGAGMDKRFTPVLPEIDLAQSPVMPPRRDGRPAERPPDPRVQRAGGEAAQVFAETQKVTLAGLRLLDAEATVVGGSPEVGMTFADVAEIETAMTGRYASAIRRRFTDSPVPALTSISRSARVRVFVAYPIVDDGRLFGIAYLSRTPDNIWRRLYAARYGVVVALIGLLAVTAGLALVTSRTILGPVDALNQQAAHIAAGRREPVKPLQRAGTQEIARLANSIADMAGALNRRALYIQEFAMTVGHEFKTPVTSIQGASELLLDNEEMAAGDRRRFIENIREDARRIERLIVRLNDLAKADNPLQSDDIVDVVQALLRHVRTHSNVELEISLRGAQQALARVPSDALEIIASNLCTNAVQAGARAMTITVARTAGEVAIAFADDGPGVGPGEKARIFDAFHTTRRDEGGTGLGLKIVRSLAEAHGGRVDLEPSDNGACFVVRLVSADDEPA
jgi:two-component system sensor histidine kinase CreC